jgi:hypothetical protein
LYFLTSHFCQSLKFHQVFFLFHPKKCLRNSKLFKQNYVYVSKIYPNLEF